MNVKNLIAAVAVFAAAGSAFAQQTEFVAPDAGFKSSLTRAEVREEARHYVILDGSNRKIYR